MTDDLKRGAQVSDDLLTAIVNEALTILEPLRNALENPEQMDVLLRCLNTDTKTIGGLELQNGLTALSKAIEEIEKLRADASPSLGTLRSALNLLGQSFEAIRGLSKASPAYPGLGADLIELLVMLRLRACSPLTFQILLAVGLIDVKPMPLTYGQNPVTDEPVQMLRFAFDRLDDWLTDPSATLKGLFPAEPLATVESANETADTFVARIGGVITALDVPWIYGYYPEDAAFLGDAAAFVDHALLIYAPQSIVGDSARAGLCLVLSSKDRDDLGLVVTPFGGLTVKKDHFTWKFEMGITAEIRAFAVGGGKGFQLLADTNAASVEGHLKVVRPQLEGKPAFILGAPTGTRLEIGSAEFAADTTLSQADQTIALGTKLSSSKVVLAPGDADSFLASFLPPEGVEAKFDLGLEWSNTRGLSFSGAAGLDATIPVGLSLGDVLTVPSIHLGLQAKDGEIAAEVSVSLSLSLGPVTAVADRIGIKTIVTFPEDGGNVGVADFAFDFKPPSGVGIKIDAPAISGGGFLFFDFDKGEYAGVLQLTIQDQITVTAIGMITTRLPNGAKGFSFVVIITAQGFQPIQLGLGFTLTGIGGLLAINRTCNEEFLREGIKTNALDSLLFPSDPIRNAPQILGLLNNAFPPQPGSFLFGPVVQICWGTPALLTMNLAVILELGKRTRLIILGVVKAIMPTEKHDLIRLQMNALGVIDFDQCSISLDAVLFDSRLLGKFPLTGGMAMRLNWGSAPVFALSVGGFHPAFKPPPNFPSLERLAITFSNTSDFKLRLECYYAITANSVQWGAKMELFAKAGGFSIEGRLGYDVLIQISPFFFVAGFYASVQLKYHSRNLFKVSVEGELSGPRPLRIKGKATFEVFWCDFSVSFDKTLVSGQKPESVDPLDVMTLLLAALNDARNWSGDLPQRERRLVTLREEAVAGQISFHPLGTLSVKQTVVPLELEIARFGSSTPSGERLFAINSFSLNGNAVSFNPVKEFFSPAQFLELSDDEKLVAPSFEAMKAGATVTTESYLFTTNDEDILEDEAILYETVIVDDEFVAPSDPLQPLVPTTPAPAPPMFTLTAESLTRSLSFGAAGGSALRSTGAARYRPAAAKNTTARKAWTVASTEDASPQEAPGLAAGEMISYSQSFAALQKAKQENPKRAKELMLVRLSKS